jgi:hypothetical protein
MHVFRTVDGQQYNIGMSLPQDLFETVPDLSRQGTIGITMTCDVDGKGGGFERFEAYDLAGDVLLAVASLWDEESWSIQGLLLQAPADTSCPNAGGTMCHSSSHDKAMIVDDGESSWPLYTGDDMLLGNTWLRAAKMRSWVRSGECADGGTPASPAVLWAASVDSGPQQLR